MNGPFASTSRSAFLHRRIFFVAVIIVIALAFVACADSDDEATVPVSSEVPTEQAEFGQYGVCYEPTETVRRGLARTLIRDDLGMRAFFMVRQPYDSISWTIAADIEGPGLEGEGPIALFDALGQTVPEIFTTNVQALNHASADYTTMRSYFIEAGEDVFELQYEEDLSGIEILTACIKNELAENPSTMVYS